MFLDLRNVKKIEVHFGLCYLMVINFKDTLAVTLTFVGITLVFICCKVFNIQHHKTWQT